MKRHLKTIIGLWLVTTVMLTCGGQLTHPNKRSLSEKKTPCQELEKIDSLMWKRADSAFALLQKFVVSPKADSLDKFDGHYCQLLISELLFKNDYEQTNRKDLLKAVAFFDSLLIADRLGADTGDITHGDRLLFLNARGHYSNGVGYYEQGDLARACEEYLKALEVMEDRFKKKNLAEEKIHFMAYTYNRLGDMFSSQFMMENAIMCYKKSWVFSTISPISPYSISDVMYRIGIQYNMMKDIDSAYYYYSQAISNMPDSNNTLYRDMVSSQVLLAYQLTHRAEPSILRLKQLITQANDSTERLARFLAVGDIYFEEHHYDSARYYLEPVFNNNKEDALQIEIANYLRVIYDSLEYSEKLDEIMLYLALHNKSGADNKAMASKLEDVFQKYLNQKQKEQSEIKRQKSIKKTVGIIVPFVIIFALLIIIVAKQKSKKVLMEQQAKANKVIEKMEREYEEELKRLQTETEQHLKEAEKKHRQWMKEAKERHAEELRAQKDKSEKEIEKTKKRHEKELETERLAYEKEQETLRQNLLEREEQMSAMEKVLNQQHIEAKQQRIAFIKEPICQHILSMVCNKHITTRDNAYELGIALKSEDFEQLKAAVAKHYDGFDHALLCQCRNLKPSDLTLCHLYLLGLSDGVIAALKSRTYSAIKKHNVSLEKKLGLEENLSGYVLKMAEGLCGTSTKGHLNHTEGFGQNNSLISSQKSTQKIIEIISASPHITLSEIATCLGMTRRGVDKNIKQLKELGIIRRVGPDKGGHWEVIE